MIELIFIRMTQAIQNYCSDPEPKKIALQRNSQKRRAGR